MNSQMEQSNPKRRRLNFEKCTFCRRDKKKCKPESRKWPDEKCDRCLTMGLPCSTNGRASHGRETSSNVASSQPSLPENEPDLKQLFGLLIEASWIRWGSELVDSARRIESVSKRVHVTRMKPGTSLAMTEVFKTISRAKKAIPARLISFEGKQLVDGRHCARLFASYRSQIGADTWWYSCKWPDLESLSTAIYQLREKGNIATAADMQEILLCRLVDQHKDNADSIALVVKDYIDIYSNMQSHIAQSSEFGLVIIPPFHRLIQLTDDSHIIDTAMHHLDVNATDFLGDTALHFAAAKNSRNAVKCLLEMGAVINTYNNYGYTPMDIAALSRSSDVLELLLQADERPEGQILSYTLAGTSDEVFHYAIPQNTDELLHFAVASGSESTVQRLLSSRLRNFDLPDPHGRTPLSYAAELGLEKIVDMLLDTPGVYPDSHDVKFRTPLSFAAASGHTAVMRMLLADPRVTVDGRDISDMSPLSYAVKEQHVPAVQRLLETGLVVVDSSSSTCISTPLIDTATNGNQAIARLLLYKGHADVNRIGLVGRSALSYAAEEGHAPIVRLLLEKDKAALNVRDELGRSPLSYGQIWAVKKSLEYCSRSPEWT